MSKPEHWLSVAETSRRLGVTPCVVDNLVRAGSLHAEVTESGVRRFREGDVDALEFAAEGCGQPLSEQVRLLAHDGDLESLTQLLVERASRDGAVGPMLDEWVTPAMVQTGELWHQGLLSITEEHVTTATIIESLIQLRTVTPHQRTHGLGVSLTVGQNPHDLGARLAQTCIDFGGFRCVFLGSGLSAEALAGWCNARRAELVAVSVGLTTPVATASAFLRELERHLAPSHTLIVGGAGVARGVEIPARAHHLLSLTELEAATRAFALESDRGRDARESCESG